MQCSDEANEIMGHRLPVETEQTLMRNADAGAAKTGLMKNLCGRTEALHRHSDEDDVCWLGAVEGAGLSEGDKQHESN